VKSEYIAKIKDNRKKLAMYFVLIVCFLMLIVYLAVRFGPRLTVLAADPGSLSEMLNSYGWKGILVFIAIQVLQVVVAAIPGEVVQIAGGYIYGTWLGTLYSMAGIFLGSILVFFTARLLGYPIVKLLASQEQLDRFRFMINNNKSEAAMFVLFLIPGIPKDILTYIAGITPVKPLRFFVIIIVGRLPALLASSYIGHHTQEGNFRIVLILSAIAVVLFLAGLLLKDRIIDGIHHLTNRSQAEEPLDSNVDKTAESLPDKSTGKQ